MILIATKDSPSTSEKVSLPILEVNGILGSGTA